MPRKYMELSKAKVQENRNVVISKNDIDGGFTVAQQVIFKEPTSTTAIFLKGAIHVADIEGLYNLRDAINEAIDKEEK